MAELLGDPAFYAALIVVVVVAVIAYYEMKYLRRIRARSEENRAMLDDIYNQIVSTRAISNVVKGQGRNTKDADLVILEADMAYSRGNYTEARTVIERAKDLLRDAKREPTPTTSMQFESIPRAAPEGKAEECEVPFQEAKKMPKNFLESKFMICSVRDEAQESERAGNDVTLAMDDLKIADDAFAREQYTDALKFALKAKKVLDPKEGASPKETRIKDLGAVEKIPSTVVIKPPFSKCEKCGAEMDSGDIFCSMCGAKVERDIRCPRCANKVKVNDTYCRQCGLPLKHD